MTEANKMPENARLLYDELWQQVVWLRQDWSGYKKLFDDQDTVELLNRTASLFFGRQQQIMVDYILLSIARLLDPASSGPGKDNMTLPALVSEVRATADAAFTDALSASVTGLKTSIEAVVRQRHKRIAHLDRAVSLGQQQIEAFSVPQIEAALKGIEAVLDAVDGYYNDGETEFDVPIMHDEVERLLLHLKAARILSRPDFIRQMRLWTPVTDRDSRLPESEEGEDDSEDV